MLYSKLASFALLVTGTSAAALQHPSRDSGDWQVTDFSVRSQDGEDTQYNLKITGEGETDVVCSTSNDVESTTCGAADGPSPFNKTICGENDAFYFTWSFQSTNTPTPEAEPAYFIQFTYNEPDYPTVYGCSPLFDVQNNTVCYEGGEELKVPSSFSVQPTNMTECIYA